jgi:redox-sensing transcriptional repressor
MEAMKENNTFKFMPVMSVKRLSAYLRFLKAQGLKAPEYVSGAAIAEEFGTLPVQVRKDLQCAGIKGAPRLGYPRKKLIAGIESFLGWDNTQDAFLAGVGKLGNALLAYKDFERELGLKIIAAFDNAPEKEGTRLNGVEILPVEKLGDLAKRMRIKIGIIATPPNSAQELASMMANAGIRAIWNFAPINLRVPSSVIVENAGLSASLSVLTSKLRKTLEMEHVN